MEKLIYCCIIILCSFQSARGNQPVLTINLGVSPYRAASGLSSYGSNLCYGIGFEAYDTTMIDVNPFINFERNSWSVQDISWSNYIFSYGFKLYITKNIYTIFAMGIGTGDDKIAAYLLPGIGAEFKIGAGTALFVDARYTMLVQDASVYFLPIRAGLKVALSGK